MAADRLQVIYQHLSFGKLAKNHTNSTFAKPARQLFRYTLNNPMLSYEQRRFYEDNGYLLIPKLIEHDLLDACRQRFVDLCNGKVPKGKIIMMKDISLRNTGAKGEYLINKIQDILFDDILENYAFHSKLLDYVECFVGPNVRAMHSMLINKPPDSGALTSRHPLHQDLHYFPFRPIDRIVASWTAMEPVHIDNGCLVVIPGSHKGELLQHDYPNWEGGINKGFHGIKGYDNYKTVPLIMEKGDTVFFHPLLIHGSGVNRTKGFRKAISIHFCTSDQYYIGEEEIAEDESIKKDLFDIYKVTGDGHFQDVWEIKSRHVRGYREEERVQRGIKNN